MKDKDIHMNSGRKELISVIILILLIMATVLYHFYYQSRIGPEQPIAFSHRLHTQEKNISCLMCHEGAAKQARAGIPPLETCMLCHDRIIIHHPEIEKVRELYAKGEAVEWVKVNDMPDFSFFNHSVHLFRKIDCAECHGNVKAMDRIERFNELKMDFCIDCHRDKNATTDCFTCHR